MTPPEILMPEHCQGEPYRSRWDVFRGMTVGETRKFHASTDSERASVRGAAYGYARSVRGRGRRLMFSALRIDRETVSIRRVR